jgi:hypothetical protein
MEISIRMDVRTKKNKTDKDKHTETLGVIHLKGIEIKRDRHNLMEIGRTDCPSVREPKKIRDSQTLKRLDGTI